MVEMSGVRTHGIKGAVEVLLVEEKCQQENVSHVKNRSYG